MILRNIRTTLEMIKIEHTLFALPFAFLGAVLAASGVPTASQIIWITVAMVGARSTAMAFNRIADKDYDARNPRTEIRAIPSGALSVIFVWGFTLISAAVFLVAAAMLNRLTLLLSPVALASVMLYSYTKRWTLLSHLILGWCLAIAPTGAWIAVRGAIDNPVPLLLSLAVLVLRYKSPGIREWKVPLNVHIGSTEVPIGLIVIALVLFTTAIVNLLTKSEATIAGVTFSAIFFAVFTYSEHRVAKKRKGKPEGLAQFRVYDKGDLVSTEMGARPGNILVAVRDPRNLYYLRNILARTDTTKQDVVVMTARLYHREHSFSGSRVYDATDIFDHYEQELFTAVVSVAEKEGKPVSLLVVPATDVFEAIVLTAQRLDSSRVVCGLSNKLTADEQAKLTGDAWERLPEPRPRLILEVYSPDGAVREYTLGPHTPRLRPQDLELLHRVWLEVTSDPRYAGTHHYHIVALALEELHKELNSGQRSEVLGKLHKEVHQGPDAGA